MGAWEKLACPHTQVVSMHVDYTRIRRAAVDSQLFAPVDTRFDKLGWLLLRKKIVVFILVFK